MCTSQKIWLWRVLKAIATRVYIILLTLVFMSFMFAWGVIKVLVWINMTITLLISPIMWGHSAELDFGSWFLYSFLALALIELWPFLLFLIFPTK
jgi:hypothetical protein